MPIVTVDEPSLDADFVVFWSSRDENGVMWCPDCRRVESITDSVFGGDQESRTELVYVGPRPEWKSRDNKYRQEPWKINAVPTIVKLSNGKEEARLVEDDILDTTLLGAFVGRSL